MHPDPKHCTLVGSPNHPVMILPRGNTVYVTLHGHVLVSAGIIIASKVYVLTHWGPSQQTVRSMFSPARVLLDKLDAFETLQHLACDGG